MRFRKQFARYFQRTVSAAAAVSLLSMMATSAVAQSEEDEDDEVDSEVEEIVVVGSQIRGARITGALPVSVVDAEQIEALGIDSGDELFDYLPENGNNFFNEAENISGGVNSARGDVGAFNLRSLGTGNTLVLMNGRRMVNSASYQTEEVGGSFVPVNTVNSNTIPVFGVQRVEVLREGASAIYGADAVAGVVNTVLKTDFEGLTIRTKLNSYDHVPREDQSLDITWGKYFNDRRTNVGVMFGYYHRDRVSAQDEARWADSDFRYRVPAGSPWEGSTSFRNNSANSLYGQYDVRSSASAAGLSGVLTDSSGEFETYPAGDPRCQWDLGYGTCGGIDGQGTYRYNLNEFRDLSSDLDRTNLMIYINHDFENGVQSFTELLGYQSKTNLNRHPSAPFSTVKLRVAADNYYNPFGPCGSPNRLPDSVIGTDVPCSGLELEIDNYRFAERPRIVDNDGDTYRFLQGFRGSYDKWDWETALTWSRATKDDITRNRVSNTLAQEALSDPTPAAYNPFSGGVDNNIERILVDVSRLSETELRMVDFKISTPELLDLPAGPVGILAGIEYREESFVDDRDPRLDGTIVFTDWQGDTYPFVSDVVNSSPTPDSRGERDVLSLFGELQIPLLDNLDAQVALRYEDFSDVGNTTVGKLALGWRVIDQVLLRTSVSTAFRAPNLVTINEEIVARQNTRTDWACFYAAENGGDPNQDTLDCTNSTQRIAQGSDFLQPEESVNFSIGVVVEPIEDLSITLDYWSIEKDDTIGLFGEENHTILDLIARLDHGNADCSTLVANPAVNREATVAADEAAIYNAAGICPAGLIQNIDDQYANLDKRTVEGLDLGVYYNFDSALGNFDIRYVGSFLQKYEQEAGGDAAILVAAQQSGQLPANIPVSGFADLIRRDGNQEDRQNLTVSWRRDDFGASATMYRIGDFYQDSLTLSDGTQYTVPAMTTVNLKGSYTWEFAADRDARFTLGINNVGDERAPLADRYFGYFADSHRDLGRYYYVDVRLSL
jgi:iron complex outermembrane recepter protein